jgi:serine/threonine protein kinase/tetratricopeptide (TPR) repeat protein
VEIVSMAALLTSDEDLVRRLPLPLAQLYRRAHNAKNALERHLTAYYLWEAALKLLAGVAVVEYAAGGEADPQLAERLQALTRPALGHWWEFVRLLVPALAERGDPCFQKLRELLLGRTRDDLPRAAGLEAELRQAAGGTTGARSTVRLTELFDRLVQYRNRELGHGAAGRRPADFYDAVARALLGALGELLGRLDVLAGRRLLYVGDVRRHGSGAWLVERFEMTGEAVRRVESLEVPESEAARLPRPDRVYLEGAPTGGALPALVALHPLLVYDADAGEALFLNARRGRRRTEYLAYTTGRVLDRADLGTEQRALLARALGYAVDDEQTEGWAARAQAEEEAAAPGEAGPTGTPPHSVGEFELLSELGRGGMGVVYRAWQPSLGRQVALKCLLRLGDPKAEARFAREIRALGRVEHPHLVKVFTSGSQGEQWFYAMELVEGATLAAVCAKLQAVSAGGTRPDLETWCRALSTVYEESRRAEKLLGGTPPPAPAPAAARQPRVGRAYVRHVVELVGQAAEAAHALHEAGVVHRDIKPGNIMTTADGSQAVLMDLGLAQLADDVQGKLTRTRQFVGTLRYASPEQVLAVGTLDRRSDVYSLGATLWELLTLRPLYGADEQTPTPELMQRIQYQEPEPPRRHHAGVPADLEAIVLKSLEKDPKRRYATARELADDLGRFLRDEPVLARPPSTVYQLGKFARRHKAVVAGLVGVFLALVLGILGTSVSLVHARAERQRAEGEWQRAEEQRGRAETEWQRAEGERQVAEGERNRAQEAERKKGELLAASYRQTAELAMRRGAWRAALDSMDEAVRAGCPDSVDLHLGRVRALAALNEGPQAFAEVRELAARTDLGDQAGLVLLWRAELALDQSGADDKTLARIAEALRRGLPEAEKAYAEGLLADSSPAALEHFRHAVGVDPFHQRANGMAIRLLTFLGLFDEARTRVAFAEQVFPDDPTFQVLHAEILALQGDLPAAYALVDRAPQLREPQRRTARAMLEPLAELAGVDAQMKSVAPDFETSWASVKVLARMPAVLQASRAAPGEGADASGDLVLPLPPVVVRAWRVIPSLFPMMLLHNYAGASKALADAIRIHPDGLLYFLRGLMLTNEDRWAEAEEAFLAAAGRPSVVPIRRMALMLAIACEFILAETELSPEVARLNGFFAARGPVGAVLAGAPGGALRALPSLYLDELPLRRALRNTRTFLGLGKVYPKQADLLANIALLAREFDLARGIVDDWQRQAPEDVNAWRKRALVELAAGAYGPAIRAADKVLAVKADDREALDYRAKAVERLRRQAEQLGK